MRRAVASPRVAVTVQMEREATFQLQAEMMQKNIMEMTKQAQQGPQLPPSA